MGRHQLQGDKLVGTQSPKRGRKLVFLRVETAQAHKRTSNIRHAGGRMNVLIPLNEERKYTTARKVTTLGEGVVANGGFHGSWV